MIRLRYKVGLLFMLVAVTGIGATTFVTTRTFIADKHSYVMELNSTAAPYIATAVGTQLEFIHAELVSLGEMLASANLSAPGRAAVLDSAFRRMRGARRLDVFDQHGLVASLAAAGADEPQLSAAEAGRRLAAAPRGSGPRQTLRAGSKPLLISQIDGRLYAIALGPELFAPFLELTTALSVSLLGENGIDPLGKAAAVPVPTEAAQEIWKSIFESGGQAVLARELKTPGGVLLAVGAPIPGLDGQAILVHAPSSQVGQMIHQVLLAALPYVAVVLFLALLMGLIFSHRIVLPIEEVTTATSRIAGGEWHIQLAAKSKDEIGVLVDSFSKMGEELARRESALQHANEELRRSERLSSLGRLSAGIAHEVKNPLNAILGYAQLIERKLPQPIDESAAKYLGFIMDETRRASKIISDLLTFARQKPPTLSRQELEPILARAQDLAQPQAAAAQVTIVPSYRGKQASAEADPDQLLQVLLNLMINACHAMEGVEPGKPRELALDLRLEGDRAVIEVRDTGTGIAPENLSRIFEPFFSTKAVGKGSGLGLALCHGIIEQHRGKIEVSSQLGQGTSFLVQLPSKG